MANVIKYGDKQEKIVKNLIDNHKYEKVGNQVIFDAEKIEYEKGITNESIKQHVDFINNVSSGLEIATGRIVNELGKDNKDLGTVSSTLSFQGVTINSQFQPNTVVGEEHYYGVGTTIIDYPLSNENSEWLHEQRNKNAELAKDLFSK